MNAKIKLQDNLHKLLAKYYSQSLSDKIKRGIMAKKIKETKTK